MIPPDERLMISALQHYVYCPRQFAIIHQEQYWRENFFTADGRQLHRRVDLPGRNSKSAKRRVEYALPLASEKLGLTGVADAVEFLSGNIIVPVEYKRGKDKPDDRDRVQLCAQTLCLEEMMKTKIELGALFYFENRERVPVEIDESLRSFTLSVIKACQKIMAGGEYEVPVYAKRCRACSLFEYCLPPTLKSCAITEFFAKELIE